MATPTPTAPTTTSAGTPSPTSSSRPPLATPAIDAGWALDFAVGLADEIGARIPGTEGDQQARARITAAFEESGWQVQADVLALPQGGATANLVATIDGIIPDGPMVVVGSHMDTLGGVGANDNASGVGVLLAVARELADEAASLSIPVVLVAFAAEERQDAPGRPNHLGSEQLAATLGDRVVTMLSVDMVGNGPTTRIVGMDDTDSRLVQRLADLRDRAGFADVVTASAGNLSDHGAFARRGIPAAFLWTGPDGRLHTTSDTSDQLDIDDLARAGALTLALIMNLTPDDANGLSPTQP